MLVIVDTGVFVSALISSRGALGQIMDLLLDGRFELVYSKEILLELIEVLNRPRIRNKYPIGPDEISAMVELILLRGRPVFPNISLSVCRDPRDDKFLEAAVESDANVIVTGDRDLLALHPYMGINIITPVEFINLFSHD